MPSGTSPTWLSCTYLLSHKISWMYSWISMLSILPQHIQSLQSKKNVKCYHGLEIPYPNPWSCPTWVHHTSYCACIGVRNGNQEIRGSWNTCLGLIGHRKNPKLFQLQSSEMIVWIYISSATFAFIWHSVHSLTGVIPEVCFDVYYNANECFHVKASS